MTASANRVAGARGDDAGGPAARARRWLRRALWLSVVVSACNGPMIPLPPPAAEDIVVELGATPGILVISAAPREGQTATSFPADSRVDIINQTLRVGVIVWTDDVGAFEVELAGEIGDRVTLEYFAPSNELSESLCLEVDKGRQTPLSECPIGP